MELMQEDFPAPVAPAINTCGSCSRSSISGRPEMSSPRPTVKGARVREASAEDSTSPSVTKRRSRLGTSTPMADRPGIGASRRTSGVASA